MPIYTYQCSSCGEVYEEVIIGRTVTPPCPVCGNGQAERVLSPSSSLSGRAGKDAPGSRDHGCCGSRPGDKGCVPGTCCGKA